MKKDNVPEKKKPDHPGCLHQAFIFNMAMISSLCGWLDRSLTFLVINTFFCHFVELFANLYLHNCFSKLQQNLAQACVTERAGFRPTHCLTSLIVTHTSFYLHHPN